MGLDGEVISHYEPNEWDIVNLLSLVMVITFMPQIMPNSNENVGLESHVVLLKLSHRSLPGAGTVYGIILLKVIHFVDLYLDS